MAFTLSGAGGQLARVGFRVALVTLRGRRGGFVTPGLRNRIIGHCGPRLLAV
jgi:hypothetical protein